MTIPEMKKFLGRLIGEQMPGPVVWAEQYSTQAPLPYTTMKLKDTGIPWHPVNIVKDGEIHSFYGCERILEINRYTAGVAAGDGCIAGMENTAVDGLTSLLLFLQSDRSAERLFLANISMMQMGAVRDLTALEGTRYKNRAMLECKICFALEYHGGEAAVHAPKAGIKPEDGPTGYFEDVEMEGKCE